MKNIGAKVSLEGKDVQSARGQDLAFDSATTSLMVDLTADPKHYGVVDFILPAGNVAAGEVFSVAHGLPFIPVVQVGIKDRDNGNFTFWLASIDVFSYVYSYADATRLVIAYIAYNTTAARSFSARYFVYSNPVLEIDS